MKKFFTIALAATMIFSMAACSSSGDTTSTESKETTEVVESTEPAVAYVEANNIETTDGYPNSTVFTYNEGEESERRVQKFFGCDEITGTYQGTSEEMSVEGDSKTDTVHFKGYFGILLDDDYELVYHNYIFGFAFYDMYTGECLLTDMDTEGVEKDITFNGETYHISIKPEGDIQLSSFTAFYESIASNDLLGCYEMTADYTFEVPADYDGLALGIIPVESADEISYELADHPDMVLKVLAQGSESTSAEEPVEENTVNTTAGENVITASDENGNIISALAINADDPALVIEYIENDYAMFSVYSEESEYIGEIDVIGLTYLNDGTTAEELANYAYTGNVFYSGCLDSFNEGVFYYNVSYNGIATYIDFYIQFDHDGETITLGQGELIDFSSSSDDEFSEEEYEYVVNAFARNISSALSE